VTNKTNTVVWHGHQQKTLQVSKLQINLQT